MLTNALKWLIANNPFYADIQITDDWVENASTEDEELVMSMLEQPECMEEGENDEMTSPVSLSVWIQVAVMIVILSPLMD